MTRRKTGWAGANSTRARAYWRYKMRLAQAAGEPLRCSFDGRDPQCPGAVLDTDEWDVDHVVPRADGGALLARTNQQPAHSSCNRRAGQAMTMEIRANQSKGLWSW